MGAVLVIAQRSVIEIPTAFIALATGLALIYTKKLKEPHLILISGALGLGIKSLI